VGHSTGGGEVTRYIGRHGTSRVAKLVLVGAIPPLMLKTDANPGGLPIEVFDGLRAGLSADRSQFYKDTSVPFYGAALQSSKIVKDATLKVYPGAPHGLAQTTAYKDTFNADLLSFIRG
jgi:non-heme chloroperoxidase